MYEIILLSGIGIIFLLPVMGVIADFRNRKRWNNGICRECHKPWRSFDVDSQGGTGYTDGKHYLWI